MRARVAKTCAVLKGMCNVLRLICLVSDGAYVFKTPVTQHSLTEDFTQYLHKSHRETASAYDITEFTWYK